MVEPNWRIATMAIDALARLSRRMTGAVALIASISAVGVAMLPVAASPASGLSLFPTCGARVSSTPFAPWGDSKSYFMMPGGAFESGAPGWVTGGATVVGGNESYFVNARTDGHSLAIPGGAVAVSPTICVAMGENSIRLFVKSSGVATSLLHVQAFVQNPLTGLVLSTGFDVNGTTAAGIWSPSVCLTIPNLLGGLLGTQRLTLVFTTRGTPATWNIDDVFVDPFKSR
jgi:hypothetical protein